MKPEPKLNIRLSQGWVDAPGAKGKWTYFRSASPHSGTFQITYALNKGAEHPSITPETLLGICRKLGNSVKEGKTIAEHTGPCDFGTFATMQFHGKTPAHLQVWVLTDQKHFILVTHICLSPPEPQEIVEADQIARHVRLTLDNQSPN